jgi:hypothetical protein
LENLYNPVQVLDAGHIAFDAQFTSTVNHSQSQHNAIIGYIRLCLGYGMIDVEADKEHCDNGIKPALIPYLSNVVVIA